MKCLLVTQIFLLLISPIIFCQGTNNKYEFDTEDLKNIFNKQGIDVFKFPFELNTGEYISISYDVYEYGKQIGKGNILKDFWDEYKIKFNSHLSRSDTTRYHRFYFFREGDSLRMNEFLPGFGSQQKIDISKVKISAFAARPDVLRGLPEKREILFYYALYENSNNYKSTKGVLRCPTGTSNQDIIKNFDLVILFFAERISAQKASSELGEDFFKGITCPTPLQK